MVACDKCLSPDNCAKTLRCIAVYLQHKFPKDEQISEDDDTLEDGGGDDNEINNFGLAIL